MINPPTKLADIYSTPKVELADDDLSFLRSMIEKKENQEEPLDFDFLRKELSKRRPPPPPKPRGIELIEPQTKPPTRGPHYIRSRSPTVAMKNRIPQHSDVAQVSVVTIGDSKTPGILLPEEVSENAEKPHLKSPSSYVAWKYIGVMDGELGVISGKVKTGKKMALLHKDLANMPFLADSFKRKRIPEPQKPKIYPRDLFSLSIDPDSKEMMKQKIQKESKIEQETPPPPNDTQLYIQTESKLIPLVVSRLGR